MVVDGDVWDVGGTRHGHVALHAIVPLPDAAVGFLHRLRVAMTIAAYRVKQQKPRRADAGARVPRPV